MSRLLASYAEGRDNNFNLIRLIAASLVLFSHSFPLTANDAAEPLSFIGFTLGSLAVQVFFFTSGYLVFASLLRSAHAGDFMLARALRIYPALIVMNLLTVFVIGLYFTSVSAHDYLTNPDIYWFIKRNSQLFFTSLRQELPGLFADTPFPKSTNGSLWTLRTEMTLYTWLAVVGLLISFFPNYVTRVRLFFAFALGAAVFFLLSVFAVAGHGEIDRTYVLKSLFLMGAACFAINQKIILSGRVAILFLVILIALLVARMPAELGFALTIGYLTLYLSYVPAGWIRQFNRLGDYSYGIYIYAWPVQQSVVSVFPHSSPLQMSAIAFPLTLCCAVASWHFVEKPMLRLKHRMPRSKRLASQDAGDERYGAPGRS